ncbi:MAG: 2-amino-4-hydroxy-6-hydroxymethyldihydropteridine diphosphokinase [Planctomycetota bacterium]
MSVSEGMPPTPVDCLLGLGANLGDRAATLDAAIDDLAGVRGVRVTRVSDWLVSVPVGGPPRQGEFLNGAARLETILSPSDLMQQLRVIEGRHGRTRRVRWSARTLDIDLLLYGDAKIDDPRLPLEVPHQRMSFRPFVLGPAVAIAAEMRHTRLDATLGELAQRLATGDDVIAVLGGVEGNRVEVAALLAGFGSAYRIETDAEPDDRPKLQVCLDDRASLLKGTPAVWVDAGANTASDELRAAVECVWPSQTPAEGRRDAVIPAAYNAANRCNQQRATD